MRPSFLDLLFVAQDLLLMGKIPAAIRKYRAVLKEAKKDDEEELFCLTFLGMAYDDADDEENARASFRSCQKLASFIFGEESVLGAVALTNEGLVLSNRERFAEAEPFFDKAVGILRKCGCDVSHLPAFCEASGVSVYSGAADCKAKLGKIEEACELIQIAQEVAFATLPENHPLRMQTVLEAGVLQFAAKRKTTGGADAGNLAHQSLLAGAEDDLVKALTALSQAMSESSGADSASACVESSAKGSKGAPKGTPSNVVPLFSLGSKPIAITFGPDDLDEACDDDDDDELIDEDASAYQLKVTLKSVSPPVWRRVVVPSSFTLFDLHNVIQRAMGWSRCHLHEFEVFCTTYSDGECRETFASSFFDEDEDESAVCLARLGLTEGSKFLYRYDFGDGWEHSIQVEKVFPLDADIEEVQFVKAKGPCPPEDCGGPHFYSHIMRLIKENAIKRKDLPWWVEDFDPTSVPIMFQTEDAGGSAKKKASSRKNKVEGVSAKGSSKNGASQKDISEKGVSGAHTRASAKRAVRQKSLSEPGAK